MGNEGGGEAGEDMMNYEELVQEHLQPDEQVVWSGQPDAKRMTISYVLSGWGFIAILGGAIALIGRVNIEFVAFFALLTMSIMMAMALLLVYPDERRTVYVLTDRRVLFLKLGRPNFKEEMGIHDIGPIKLTERKDGTGDIYFASEQYRGSRKRTRARHLGFFHIADARGVEQQLREVFPQAAAEPEQTTG